ncbi:hypothetical protein HK405_007715, partial [Cladochytrium tenue]
RQKQISALTSPTSGLPAVRTVQRDAVFELDVPLASPPGALTLQVRLGTGFPETPPTVAVRAPPAALAGSGGGAFSHPWLDAATGAVVGCERLSARGWTPHASLARVVAEIVEELTERNPVVFRGQGFETGLQGAPPSYPSNPYTQQSRQAAWPSSGQQAGAQGGVYPDPYGLEKMSLEELEELTTDDRAFEQLLMSQPSVNELTGRRQELISSNEALARQNMGREEELENARHSLKERQNVLNELRRQYGENMQAYQNEMMRFAPDYLTSRIRAGTAESEELSESLAQSFLGGTMSIEDFLKNFRETRKVYHLRAARLERVTRDPSLLE